MRGLRIFSCIIKSLKIWLECHSLYQVKTKDHISNCTSLDAVLYPQSNISKSISKSLIKTVTYKIREAGLLGGKTSNTAPTKKTYIYPITSTYPGIIFFYFLFIVLIVVRYT